MFQMTDLELRVRRLEEGKLQADADALDAKHKASQALQNSNMDSGSNRGGGIVHYWAQANGDIDAIAGNEVGTGQAFLLQLTNGKLYQRAPELTVDVLNGTGGPIDDLTWLQVLYTRGVYTIVVADCVTVGPEKAPAPAEG